MMRQSCPPHSFKPCTMNGYARPLALIDSLNPAPELLEVAARVAAPGAALTLLDVIADQNWTWNLLGSKAAEIRNQLRAKKEPALNQLASVTKAKSGLEVAEKILKIALLQLSWKGGIKAAL